MSDISEFERIESIVKGGGLEKMPAASVRKERDVLLRSTPTSSNPQFTQRWDRVLFAMNERIKSDLAWWQKTFRRYCHSCPIRSALRCLNRLARPDMSKTRATTKPVVAATITGNVSHSPNMALNLAPFGRWTALKRRRLALR